MTTRPPLLLHLAAVAALACAVLALTACGSGKPSSARSAEDKAFDGALKFAKCMRDHGVDMPDPKRGANGGMVIESHAAPGTKGKTTNSFGPDDPKFKTANAACSKYMVKGGGPAPSPAEQAKRQDAFVAYATCMRSKGVNMPDPKVSGNGVQMRIGPGVRPDSPQFKAADAICHKGLAAVEPKGAPGGGPSNSIQGESGTGGSSQ